MNSTLECQLIGMRGKEVGYSIRASSKDMGILLGEKQIYLCMDSQVGMDELQKECLVLLQ